MRRGELQRVWNETRNPNQKMPCIFPNGNTHCSWGDHNWNQCYSYQRGSLLTYPTTTFINPFFDIIAVKVIQTPLSYVGQKIGLMNIHRSQHENRCIVKSLNDKFQVKDPSHLGCRCTEWEYQII